VNRLAFGNTSLLFLVSALLCLALADIAVTTLNPWGEIVRLAPWDPAAGPPLGHLYAYDTTPRLYGQFLAYNLYRWEIIVRESAIFGILGVATLGYHVDAAVSELRFDVAVVLILATVGLCALIDILSRRLRRALRISTLATRLADAPATQEV
jgi:hypothetical protein